MTVYLPSKGAPTPLRLIATVAPDPRVAAGDAVELGEGAGDLLGERGRRRVDLGLRWRYGTSVAT